MGESVGERVGGRVKGEEEEQTSRRDGATTRRRDGEQERGGCGVMGNELADGNEERRAKSDQEGPRRNDSE